MPPNTEDADPQQSLADLHRCSQASGRVTRGRIGAALVELYSQRGEILTDHERALIHDILRRVVCDLEADLRLSLSNILASDPTIPRELATQLANDSGDIAWPILANSQALLDEDLIEVIHARGTEHRLAIAARRHLSITVSAALVESGEQNVIIRLLHNQNAEISRATFDHLVAESKRVDSFQQPLLQRQDIPHDLLLRMYEWIGKQLRDTILQRLNLPSETIDSVLKQATADEVDRTGDTSTAKLAIHLIESGVATPRLLTNLLSDGHISLFTTILNQRTGIPRHKLVAAATDVAGEAQLILCRAIGFDRSEFLILLDETFRLCLRPRSAIEKCRPRLSDIYPRLTESGAQRALRAWAQGTPAAVALRQAELM